MRSATGVSDTLNVDTHVGSMMEGARPYRKLDGGMVM